MCSGRMKCRKHRSQRKENAKVCDYVDKRSRPAQETQWGVICAGVPLGHDADCATLILICVFRACIAEHISRLFDELLLLCVLSFDLGIRNARECRHPERVFGFQNGCFIYAPYSVTPSFVRGCGRHFVGWKISIRKKLMRCWREEDGTSTCANSKVSVMSPTNSNYKVSYSE